MIGNNKDKHFLILEKGEKIMASLVEHAKMNGIDGAEVTGIGAINQVEIGVYHLENKQYEKKHFGAEVFELISMDGNISLKENTPFPHIHASLGRENFSVLGGHMFEAEVFVTCEICVTPTSGVPIRNYCEAIGLHLIDREG